MKKKLSKVLAVVLSLVLAVGLAAVDGASVAQAAKKAKKLTLVDAGDLNVTSGETRTIKIKGNKAKKAKWSVKGDGASYVSLNKTKGKKVKMTVADNATGTVKVVAKLTKKNKVTVTYTLSCEATAITLADAEGYTNEAIALETTVTPSNATAVDVTYAVYTDEAATAAAEKATVADGALTATEAGTYYVVATAGTLTSNIAKVVVTDKLAKIESVKQIKKDVIEIKFDADASKVTDDTLLIENVNGVRVNVKTIVLDDAKTTATVTTLVNMADGKDHTVTYADSSATFTATTGEVSALQITPTEVPINVESEISALAVDVNGVILDEVKYSDNDELYTFEIELGDTAEITGNNKLKMTTVGSTVKVKVVHNTNELDANGDLRVFTGEQVITAVAEGNISGYEVVKFAKAESDSFWNGVDKVRVNGGTDGSFWVGAYVKDDLGYERVNGSLTAANFTLESADDTYLLVDGDKVTGVRAGKTFILVKQENDVKFVIPVEIEAAAELTSIEVSANSLTLTAGNINDPSAAPAFKGEEKKFEVKPKNQYGEDYGNVTIDFDAPTSVKNNEAIVNKAIDGGLKVTATDPALWDEQAEDYLAKGKKKTNTYTIKVKDNDNSGKELTKNVNVTVRRPQDTIKKLALSIDHASSTLKMDTALTAWYNQAESVAKIRLGCYDVDGVLIKYAALPESDDSIGKVAAIELRKGTTDAKDLIVADKTAAGQLVVSNTASPDAFEFVGRFENAHPTLAAVKYVTNAENASYRINVKGVKIAEDGLSVTYGNEKGYASLSATITVTNTQKGITLNQEQKSINMTPDVENVADIASKTISVQVADTNSDYNVYNYTTEKNTDKYYFEAVEKGFKITGKSLALTKIKVYVPYPCSTWVDDGRGTNTWVEEKYLVYLPVEASVNYTVIGE